MDTSKKSSETPIKPHVKKGITFFWLVPVIAVALTVYLFYQTIQNQGQTIEIKFPVAKDLAPEKTELRFHGVKIGVVKHVELSPDFKEVIVTAQLEKSADDLAREGAQFWIVYAQIGINGVSGLDTLISGNYIEMQQGTGKPTTKFEGLTRPPAMDPLSSDLFVELYSRIMPTVSVGSPILYRHEQVGKVEDLHYDLRDNKAHVYIRIYDEYRGLIREGTNFWNSSGLDLTVGLDGVTVRSGSLSSVVFGSITLDIPDVLLEGTPAASNGAKYELFGSAKEVIAKNASEINKLSTKVGKVLSLHLKNGNGIAAGKTKVRYNGVDIGDVLSVELAPDFKGVIAKVLFINGARGFAGQTWGPSVQGFAKVGTKFVLVWPQVKVKDLTHIQINPDVIEGPYFRVEPGDGAECTDFNVTDVDNDSYRPMQGLVLSLHAAQVGTLRAGAPIYYRGIPVGQIERNSLAPDASTVLIRAVIDYQYAPIVRANTKFWNSTGLMSNISIWGGVKVKTQPFGDAMEGSVSFATPDNAKMGGKVSSGTVFNLADKAEDEWLKWEPSIPLDK